MSAVSILNQGDRVSLLADGDGAASRIAELPAARAAYALRGGPGFGDLLHQRFARATSIDEIRAMAPMVLRAAQHALQVADPGASAATLSCKVSVIGWSDDGPAAFTIATSGFAPADVPFLNATPAPAGDLLMLVAGGVAIGDEDDWQAIDTTDAALRLIEAQRMAGEDASSFAELVTIDAGGTHRRILRTWPEDAAPLPS